MHDNYMSGLTEAKAKYKVLINYYQCNPILRNDIVWFQFSKRIPAVPRRVVGLPRDKFEIIEGDGGQWNIKINDVLMESNNQPLFIRANSIPPLKIFQQFFNGILPKGKYILLSNSSPGMSDSRNLGLIDEKSITGKV